MLLMLIGWLVLCCVVLYRHRSLLLPGARWVRLCASSCISPAPSASTELVNGPRWPWLTTHTHTTPSRLTEVATTCFVSQQFRRFNHSVVRGSVTRVVWFSNSGPRLRVISFLKRNEKVFYFPSRIISLKDILPQHEPLLFNCLRNNSV